jgi:predicted Zn finger-like uncharacterized protein
MLVQCPKCKTTYKVSDEVIKGASPAFRCSRCKHTFELETIASGESLDSESLPAEQGALKSRDEREMSFTFGARSAAEEGQFPGQRERQLPERMDAPAPPAPQSPTTGRGSKISEPWSMSVTEETREKPFTMTPPRIEENSLEAPAAASPHEASSEANPTSQEAADNIFSIHTYRDQVASTVPYLTLFALLVIFFFLATAYLEAHPKVTEEVVRQIPLIGPSVVRNGYLKNGVLLKSLRADYQTIQGNREVLVVSGEAVNQNPVVIREVRVVGQLYNHSGRTVEQQAIWVGNALSPQIIRGMSAQDIVDLQRLKPLKSFEVPPGDSISFAIVFLRPTKEVKDFSCKVLSAEGKV